MYIIYLIWVKQNEVFVASPYYYHLEVHTDNTSQTRLLNFVLEDTLVYLGLNKVKTETTCETAMAHPHLSLHFSHMS